MRAPPRRSSSPVWSFPSKAPGLDSASTFHEPGAVTAQIGGEAADGRLLAVVTRGRCKGPFERVEADFPPPEAELSSARALGGKSAGWRYR